MLYHIQSLRRDKERNYLSLGSPETVGYNFLGNHSLTHDYYHDRRRGFLHDQTISCGLELTTVPGSTIGFNFDFVKTFGHFCVDFHTREYIFYEILYVSDNRRNYYPIVLTYRRPDTISLIHKRNVSLFHKLIMARYDPVLVDSRIEIFANIIQAIPDFSSEKENQFFIDKEAIKKLRQIEEILSQNPLMGKLGRHSLSSQPIKQLCHNLENRFLDGTLQYSNAIVYDLAHEILPLNCPQFLFQSFIQEESISITDLLHFVNHRPVIDSFVMPLKTCGAESPISGSARILAESISQSSFTDIDIIILVDFGGTFVNVCYERVINRYYNVTGYNTWERSERHRIIEDATHHLFLKANALGLPVRNYYVRIVKTFNDEMEISIFDQLDDPKNRVDWEYIDLALESLVSYGLSEVYEVPKSLIS